jgi:hypothetical protein
MSLVTDLGNVPRVRRYGSDIAHRSEMLRIYKSNLRHPTNPLVSE